MDRGREYTPDEAAALERMGWTIAGMGDYSFKVGLGTMITDIDGKWWVRPNRAPAYPGTELRFDDPVTCACYWETLG